MKRAVILILIAALPWSVAVAQTSTATLRGVVNDESGNVFPGAEITATSLTSGFTRSATAGSDGRYTLAGLTPGRYRIDVTAPSYRASSREITVLVGQELDMNFRLTPDLVVMEQITVIGTTPVEMETSEVATNVTRQQIEGLPQNDRNFLNFASLAPGVLLSTNEFRKEIRSGAQGASAINVFIDGVSFKNDVIQGGVVGQDASRGNPFPQNAVQEFRVITQNFSAEYQKASSAIVTAVTKSGSNTLSGDGFLLYQDKSLVDENPLTGADPEYERYQWGVNVGGPIIRDRMHFFVSYEENNQDRENTVVLGGAFQNFPALRQQLSVFEGTFVSPFREDLAFAKLSFQPSPENLFDWSLNYRNETDVRGFGGDTSFEAAENVNNDVFGTTLRYQRAATTWLNEASLSYQDFKWNPMPLDTSKVGFQYEGLLRIGGRDTEQEIGQTRLALRDDLTFTALRGAGSHSLKVGGNIEQLDYTVTKFFEENPRFFFRQDISATIPYRARWGFGDPDMSADNTQYGIYAQDDWSVNEKLTLNLGLRWDYETNMIDVNYVTPAEVRQRLADDFPAKYFSDGNDREPASDLFQPRLGASYDLFGNSRTVLFAGAGRYYDRNLFNNTLDERFRLQHFVGEFFFSETGEPIPQLGNRAAVKWDPRFLTPAGLLEVQATGATGRPEVFLIENDTKVPYSNQFNVGVRQSFGPMVGSLTYVNTRSYNGFSYLWGRGFCCPQIDPAYSNVLISSDDIKTWYDAVFITLDRPFTDQSRFGFNVAYTYADAEQVGGDLFSLDKPTIGDWDRYNTPGTQDHRIVANGTVGVPWAVRLSTLIQYSSGDKFNIHDWSMTVNGQGFCFNCYTRRSGESPAWTTVDLRADKDFNFGRGRVGLSLEAFNIFNEERYEGFVDFQGPVRVPADVNPNLGMPTRLISGSIRRYQIGLRFGF
jgi:outer membrane receptor protein involved in Fe transport